MFILEKMTAIEISELGNPNVLQATDRSIPKPSPNEVLIKVAAAGVNRPDIMQRQGLYPAPPGASDIPGLEVAGSVVAAGKNVSNVTEGDIVCALVSGGGYAEYCLAPAALCLSVPENLTLIEAAGLPETFFTVWSNIFDRGALSSGETILVHGGSSGIGTTAIQLAKSFGAKVFTTAGSHKKCEFCLALGADAAINYREQDFVSCVQELTNNKGVDLILDIIGGDYFSRNINCMTFDARLIQIALQKGPKTVINLLPIMLKRLTITGSTLRARSTDFKINIAKNLLQRVWPLITSGQVRPIIHSTYPLTEAAQAHQFIESSQHIGKIILTV